MKTKEKNTKVANQANNTIDNALRSIVDKFEKINAYDYTDKSMIDFGQASWNEQLGDALDELNERLDDVVNTIQFKLDNGDYFLDD